LEIVEHEAGCAITPIHEIDFHALQILHGVFVNDQAETVTIEHTIVPVYLVGKGHAKADAAASTRRSVNPDSFDIFLYLLDQFSHLALGWIGKTQVALGQDVCGGCAHFGSTPVQQVHLN
jgi:hypothetical protein